jgi:ferric-chelate reductase [NAD(P)H]
MNQKALHLISYGLYVITSTDGEAINGQIVNTVMQVASKPPMVSVAINKENLTCEYIRKSCVFAASVLGTDAPMEFIGRFGFRSGRDIDKFENIRYRTGTTGAPVVLDYAIAYIEVAVTREVDAGTHVLFVGEVVDADILDECEPMTYAYYHQVKGGKTPDKATVYIEDED